MAYKKHVISENQTVKSALIMLDALAYDAILFTINNSGVLTGSVTDGDVRRGFVKGITIEDPVKKVSYKSPRSFLIDNVDINQLVEFREAKIGIVPIVDSQNRIIDVINFRLRKSLLPIDVVIMAGGKGTRLQPFTDVLPKPLIPIKKQTVIERIISGFTGYGVNKFLVSINYKAEILKAYFKELKPKYKLKFITENKPLGTIGSLSKVSKKEGKNLFITNCDTISDVNLGEMYKYHIKNDYDVTLLASSKVHRIPYGVCRVAENGDLKKIDEKPKFDFLVNAGLYLVNNEVIDFIPKNKIFHFTDLIKILQKKKYKIGLFTVHENKWLDVGQWDEFKKTVSFFS